MTDWTAIAELLEARNATAAIRQQTANISRTTGTTAAYVFAHLATGGRACDIPRT